MPAKKQDVARTTILVLLVLTILLSVISTWYVLDMITSVKQEYEAMPSAGYAKISVGVTGPGAESKPTINPLTGKAIVNIGVIKS
ncbi:hypothetical protein J4433_01100 [Candidatus Pacearchaeota archaeon]|nr:hypothetical protein [Candidatus Pacearchaeota archaeon]